MHSTASGTARQSARRAPTTAPARYTLRRYAQALQLGASVMRSQTRHMLRHAEELPAGQFMALEGDIREVERLARVLEEDATALLGAIQGLGTDDEILRGADAASEIPTARPFALSLEADRPGVEL